MKHKNNSVSATELCKLAFCPASIKQRRQPSSRSRAQFYGDKFHKETEQMIASHLDGTTVPRR